MKKIMFFLIIIAGLTSCTKELPVLADNSNWFIKAVNSFGRDSITSQLSVQKYFDPTNTGNSGYNLNVGAWKCLNLGSTLDTLTIVEFTVNCSGGLSLSDLGGIGLSSSSSTVAWGAWADYPLTEVNEVPGKKLPLVFNVPVHTYTSEADIFKVFCLITLKDNVLGKPPVVTSGTIQVGVRVFNPRTGKYTTTLPIWGQVCTLKP